MSELLLPVSSSRHKDSLIFSTQLFSFLDGTVCLIDTDLLGNTFLGVYRHRDGEFTEAPMRRDEMILEEEPGHSEVGFSRGMALEVATHLEEITGISSVRTAQRFGLGEAQQ